MSCWHATILARGHFGHLCRRKSDRLPVFKGKSYPILDMSCASAGLKNVGSDDSVRHKPPDHLSVRFVMNSASTSTM